MLRVLFVDDEPYVLEALRDLLRPQRHRWSVFFAGSGQEALKQIASGPIDLVVSDMRMPGMDGAALLTKLREQHPHIMRAILTGQNDAATAEKLLPVAQQMLLKPCSPSHIEEVLSRSERIRALLPDPAVRPVVGRIESLPPVPRIYAQLVSTIERGDASARDIAQIIAGEPAMSAKLLQLANSSFFRVGRDIASVEQAVVHLGFITVRNLVLSLEVFDSARAIPPNAGITIEAVRRHALLAARIASRIAPPTLPGHAAFLGGVLHELGLLVLGMAQAEALGACVNAAVSDTRPLVAIEREFLGVTDAQVGAYLLGLWGLPLEVMEAVASHDDPWPQPRSMIPELDLTTVLHLAHLLANELTAVSPKLRPRESAFDDELMSALGLRAKLPEWRKIAAAEAERLDG